MTWREVKLKAERERGKPGMQAEPSRGRVSAEKQKPRLVEPAGVCGNLIPSATGKALPAFPSGEG